MKKALIIIFSFLFCSLPYICIADEIIKGDYCYTYGDKESLKEAKELAHTMAIRTAIESYRSFITSSSNVKDFTLTNDIIQILSSGYLKNIKVLNQTVDGRTVCEKVEAVVSPQQIEKAIKQEVQKRTKTVEKMGIDNNGYIKILRVEDYDYSIEIKVKIIRQVYSSNEHLCAFAVFYNSEGDETATERSCDFNDTVKPVHAWEKKEGQWFYPGEIKSYKIHIPLARAFDKETKKFINPPYKVWLFNEKNKNP